MVKTAFCSAGGVLVATQDSETRPPLRVALLPVEGDEDTYGTTRSLAHSRIEQGYYSFLSEGRLAVLLKALDATQR